MAHEGCIWYVCRQEARHEPVGEAHRNYENPKEGELTSSQENQELLYGAATEPENLEGEQNSANKRRKVT